MNKRKKLMSLNRWWIKFKDIQEQFTTTNT